MLSYLFQKYTLYYDYVDEHTVVSAYKLPMYTADTTNTSILLTGLNSCEDYFFYVQVTSPGRSRLSTRASAHTGTSKLSCKQMFHAVFLSVRHILIVPHPQLCAANATYVQSITAAQIVVDRPQWKVFGNGLPMLESEQVS